MPKTKASKNSKLLSPVRSRKTTMLLLAGLLSLVGITYVITTRAGGAGSASTSGYSVIATYGEDGQSIGWDATKCQLTKDICHNNGSYVVEAKCGGIGMSAGIIPKAYAGGCGPSPLWQSNPAYNGISSNFAWFGPYVSQSPSGVGNGFDGYHACFNVYDKRINGTGATVYFDVVASGAVVTSTQSNLSTPNAIVCVPYDVASTKVMQYRARVVTGVIQIQNVSIERLNDYERPTAPTNLTASPANGSVSLSWTPSTDNVGVTQYQVWRNGQLIGSSATAGYTDYAVTPLTSYSYSVVAMDASSNQSAASNTVVATTLGSD